MEYLFLDLQREIALGMPSLSLVDEDCGQLETGRDTYPVTFPCVLIDLPKTDWTTFAKGIRQGSVSAVIKLCIDCYHDTHYGSGTEDRIRERMQLLEKLHGIVEGITPQEGADPWERTVSRFYSMEGGIKIYETVYRGLIDEGMD
jgi:hypothetical protein